MNQYEELRMADFVGFAHLYLRKCCQKSDYQIDIEVYTMLSELDSRLGTTASEQLLRCLCSTSLSDIIKVLIFTLNSLFKIILDN